MIQVLLPIVIGLVYVGLSSLLAEPGRRRFNALMIAGAGGAYLSGGALSPWELVFAAVLVFVAYQDLKSGPFIGIGWLLHTAWDVVHHLKGQPILPFFHDSSFGCALCDPVIALWAFGGGRSPWPARRASRSA